MRTKKLITVILAFAAIFIISIFLNKTQAASLGYVKTIRDRKEGEIIYRHQLYSGTQDVKDIWKLVTCTKDGTVLNNVKDLYCLRAGLGFTQANPKQTVVQYNQSYDLPRQYENIKAYFSTLKSETTIFNADKEANFNAVMWILDNMILEGATDEQVNTYLKKHAGYTDETLTKLANKENVLTRADIEAIQQLAIWYFTNNDQEAFNKETLPTLNMMIIGGDYNTKGEEKEYQTYADLFNMMLIGNFGTERQTAASRLYSKLITEAKKVTKGYKPTRDIIVYLAGGDAANEQPIVRVKEAGQVDVVLRKYISEINGEKLEGEKSREPVYDASKLNQVIEGKKQTTAIYTHKKEPLKVAIGDYVTYTLRLYNEGSQGTYIKQVTDYLPEYLQYAPYGKDKDGVYWLLDGEVGRTITTTDYCEVVGVGGNVDQKDLGRALKDVYIPEAEYDSQTKSYILSYVDIQITCKVMASTPYDTNITNIAEITSMADKNDKLILEDRDSVAGENLTLPEDAKLPDYTGGKNGKNDPYYDGSNRVGTDKKPYYPGQEDDDDFEKIYVESPAVDLALRKFISAVGDTKYNRAPKVDTTGLKAGQDTAIYKHSKLPVSAEIGDVVTYTIRLYNEGEVDGRVNQVIDHLDKNLKYVAFGEDKDANWWTQVEGTEYNTLTTTENCKVVAVGGKTDTKYVNGKLGDAIIPAYDKEEDKLSYIDIEVHCQVLPLEQTRKLTNIAEISIQADKSGMPTEKERDSKPGQSLKLPEYIKLPDYTGGKNGKNDPCYDGSNRVGTEQEPYYPGQEDDDDFEKVVVTVPELDLALRKYISAVDGKKLTGEDSREPVYNTTVLDNKTKTTAEYNHTKKPIEVKKGSLVTYTIRVYNEGELDGYVDEITDYLPNYLIYLPENAINKKYNWQYDEKTRQVRTTITSKQNKVGDEIYKDRANQKLVKAYDGSKKLDYIEVEIICKVDDKALGNGILTNLAQITKMTEVRGDKEKQVEKDRDSRPNGNFKLPEDKDRPTYKDNESKKPYVPGQEDDDDFEKVLVKPDFDLALRKFITKVGETPVNNRYPVVSYKDEELHYEHTKKPLDVVTGDIVTYTIRVYNEGEADGYANEITDDMPKGLEFLPEHKTNTEYRWKMLDENQEETTDVKKAKYIITDYLSVAQEKETGRKNLIKAFNKTGEITDTNPDFKEVQISFKVTYKAKTTEEAARTIINTAQISEDSDDDIDSKPNRDEVYNHKGNNEDDIDYDQIKVKYFDLALLKWVGQTKITLNGKTEVANTGHTAENAKNEDPVKIEIPAKDVKKINIKYIYTIRIMNEGEIEGYAKEITDYIPEGLKFVKEDNPDWYEISKGVVGTKALENKLLKPGEFADVQITLTWINNSENFGEKVNLAEISKDYNESGSPDVDSTPNNKVPGEDDIDDAPVVLAVKTGRTQIYVGLTLIILVTFAGGVGLIKKYVLE